jgi:uncharacterized protein (TIGR01568 family)
MGRRKFRLSDMMPNSWFNKLRDMRRLGGRSGGAYATHRSSSSSLGARGGEQPDGTLRPVPVPMLHRTSYYYASRDRVQPSSPAPQATGAATEDRHHQLGQQTQSPSRSCRRQHMVGSVGKEVSPKPAAEAPDAQRRRRDQACIARDGGADAGKHRRSAVTAPSSKNNVFTGKVIASDTDIIFDLRDDDVPERVLRGNSRRSSVSSGRRLKTRANSPRLAAFRCRKSKPTNAAASSPRKMAPPPLADSFAVVKASVDPRRDFRESMAEMIAEKGIREVGDLEDLLASYLALNAAEYHDLIVEVFEEIWTVLPRVNP